MPETWIYHERQEALLCGQHALNNLVQASRFTPGSLADIAHQLDQLELNFMAESNERGVKSRDYIRRLNEGSGNVDPSGNFSIQVLRAALQNEYNLELPNLAERGVQKSMDVTEMEGFICNRSEHWFAIRQINKRFWNLNSTLERPEQISHFRLALEIERLQNQGYAVFCVTNGLPPPCTSLSVLAKGHAHFWWKEADLLGATKSESRINTSSWDNVGSGIRLDGKSTSKSNRVIDLSEDMLTEDEMVALAMSQSLVSSTPVPLPDEPAAGTPGVVRIQFRMPDGKCEVRRFLESDTVAVVYSFVQSKLSSTGPDLELRYGFPPNDLAPLKEKTVGECELGGGNVQCRYV